MNGGYERPPPDRANPAGWTGAIRAPAPLGDDGRSRGIRPDEPSSPQWQFRVVVAVAGALTLVVVVGIWLAWAAEQSLHRQVLDLIATSGTGVGTIEHMSRPVVWMLAAAAVLVVALIAILVAQVRFRDQVASRSAVRIHRHTNTFEGSPVALWEMDLSQVGVWMQSLRDEGVTDLRAYLADRPEALDHGIGLVHILAINPAARRLINSDDSMFLFGGPPGATPRPELRASMLEQMDAVWCGDSNVIVDVSGLTTGGDHIDGVLFWQAARLANGSLDLANVMVAVVDVSSRVAAELNLVRMIRDREQLTVAISHELRTPLTSVIGFLSVLRDLPEDTPGEEVRYMLDAAAEEADSLGFLVEDLLVAARKGLGNVPVRSVVTPLREIVSRTLENLASSESRALDFDIVVDDRLQALADPVRVRQILRNLFINAIRYGGEHRRVEASIIGSEVVVQVIDDGAGVDSGKGASLFEPYRNAQANPSMPGSLGLGLTISRTLARAMGGELSYHRRHSETIFQLRLPCPLTEVEPDAKRGQYPWAALGTAVSTGVWGAACEFTRDGETDGAEQQWALSGRNSAGS